MRSSSSIAVVRLMARNGSTECLNFSAYPFSGVFQTVADHRPNEA